MTTEQQHAAPVTEQWGSTPPSGKPRWSGRRTAAVAGVAAAIALAGGATVYATTSGSDTSSTSTQGPGGAAPGGAAPGGGAGGTTALHGTYTVADTTGSGYHTELMQSGKVTAVSATSITVVSDDNYTKSYTVDSDTVVQAMSAGGPGSANSSSSSTLTISSIATGDEVSVTAQVSGTTTTVDTITEQS